MTLPADVTVTVCGPAHTESQAYTLQVLQRYFDSIDSGYLTATVEINAVDPLAKTLAVRTTREEFVTAHGLVGLRFEECNREGGIAGTAKIW